MSDYFSSLQYTMKGVENVAISVGRYLKYANTKARPVSMNLFLRQLWS